jgi:hypothetical protein
MISQYLTHAADSACFSLHTAMTKMVLQSSRKGNFDGETCIRNRLHKPARQKCQIQTGAVQQSAPTPKFRFHCTAIYACPSAHYYMTHAEINPTRIVPIGPVLDLQRSHTRERLS